MDPPGAAMAGPRRKVPMAQPGHGQALEPIIVT